MVNILEAKTHLSQLVEEIASGALRDIIIAGNGKPVAWLVPIEQRPVTLGVLTASTKFRPILMSATRKSLLSSVPTDAHFAGYASGVVGSDRRSAVGATAQQLLLDPRNQIYVSAATIWEVAIKHRKHPHIMPMAPDVLKDACVGSGFHWLDISVQHAKAATLLPLLHADPFDRMLAAQAMQEPTVLLTRDQQITAYSKLVRLV